MEIKTEELEDWRQHNMTQRLKRAIETRLTHETNALKNRAIDPRVLSSPEQVAAILGQSIGLSLTESFLEDLFESSAEDLEAALEISDEE